MKTIRENSNPRDELFIRLIHKISDVFQDHAVLKGGMALRLLESPRMTNDLDYTFIPYSSKKEIMPKLKRTIEEIPGIRTEISLHSNALRINIYFGDIAVQVEANVAKECKAQPISTRDYAQRVNEQGKIIRIMSFDTALAHKLAAWNERRLVRDISLWVYVLLVSEGSYTRKVLSGFYSGLGTGYLPAFYDVYFLYKMVKVMPDMDTLQKRLGKIQSRIPKFRTVKKMSLSIFLDNLRKYIELLDEKIIIEQLSPLMNKDDLSGLELKIRTAVNELIEKLSD